MKFIQATLVLTVFLSLALVAQQPAAKIPNFKFFTLDHHSFTDKNLKAGRKLLFIFFDVTCEHCQRAITTFNRNGNELNNAAVYLITLDNQASINQFMKKYGSNLYHKKNVTILQDLQNQFISKFGPGKYPSMFLYSPDRKLILYGDDDKKAVEFLKAVNGTFDVSSHRHDIRKG